MPQIEAIETRPYNIPLKSPLRWGKGHELNHLNHVLIRVQLSDGSFGLAESTPRPTIYGETQASVIAIIEQFLAPLILGKTVHGLFDMHDIDKEMSHIKNNHTAKGTLNIALHCALAMSQGKSLSQYLYAKQETIRVSYIVGAGADEVVYEDVSSAYQAGVRVFKIKIGKDIQQEINLIKQLQQKFTDAIFYVDANQCLGPYNAPVWLEELHNMGVLYCEEPLEIHISGIRENLHQRTTMPIIADDSAFTLVDVQRELSQDTFDILNIKTPRTGFSQSQLMASIVQQNNKKTMVGSQASSLLGALHSVIFASSIRSDCATECTFFLKTEADLTHAPPIIDGYMKLADIQQSLNQMNESEKRYFS